jgi:hypothetical protein
MDLASLTPKGEANAKSIIGSVINAHPVRRTGPGCSQVRRRCPAGASVEGNRTGLTASDITHLSTI